MAVNAINSSNGLFKSGSSSAPQTHSRTLADINPNDFFRLLVAQLQQQDPLKPTDNQAILQQMSMIRQLQSSTDLQGTLSSLATQQRMGTTASLIGKYVIGTADTAGGGQTPTQGVVVGVSYMADGRTLLELHDGRQLPADKVETITLVDNLPGGSGNSSDSTGSNGSTPPAGDGGNARLRTADAVAARSANRPLVKLLQTLQATA